MRQLIRDTLTLAGRRYVVEAPAEALELLRRLYPAGWLGGAAGPPDYRLDGEGDSWQLRRGDRVVGPLRGVAAGVLALEHEIETELVTHGGDRIALHAGGIGAGGRAQLIAGQAGAGKSTATLQLLELGHSFLCEEVALVDPDALTVEPHLRALGLEPAFLEELDRWRPLRAGAVDRVHPDQWRYWPHRRCGGPLVLETIFLPRLEPGRGCEVTELDAAEALPEILGYCFAPGSAGEAYFDRVIRLLESCRIVRVRYDGIAAAHRLWQRLLPASEPR